MCSGQGDVHITCAPSVHPCCPSGRRYHPAQSSRCPAGDADVVVALLLVAWWWPGVVASPRGIMLMWWWGCGGVLCAVGMWEVMWGGVGLAPVLLCSSPPCSSSLPAHLIPAVVGLLPMPVVGCSSSSLCSCGVASPLLAPDLMPWWWWGGLYIGAGGGGDILVLGGGELGPPPALAWTGPPASPSLSGVPQMRRAPLGLRSGDV